MKQLRLSAVFLILLFLMSAVFGVVDAQALEPKIPAPTKEFYVNDFAKILQPGTASTIVSLGEQTYKTSEGGQVVFVSVDSLNGSTIEEYANALFNKWGIGTKDKGILFIISMEERRARIETGYGAEGLLTDLESHNLLTKFSELNKEKGMDEAVETIYSDLCSVIGGDRSSLRDISAEDTQDQGSAPDNFFSEHPILSIILGIFILILIILDFALTGGQVTFFIIRMAAASSRRGGGGGGRNSGGGGRSGGGGSSSGF